MERVASARVLVVGAGGLGCPASLALARAGVGHLTLVDPDRVDVTNLHRQLWHRTPDVGRLKVESAAEGLRRAFPALRVETLAERVDERNAASLFQAHDAVVDATDGTSTKLFLSDVAVATGVPLVYGGAAGRQWYRPHTHVTALAPVFSGRAIVNGTFTHPSPIAALTYRGDAGPGAITRLVEQLDGVSLFGQALETLEPETFSRYADALAISAVVAIDEDAGRLRTIEENGAFTRADAPAPFLMWVRRHGVELPRAMGRGRWQISLTPDGDDWVSARTAYYPLWRARVQGAPVETRRGRLGDLQVRLDRAAGARTVELDYGPRVPEIMGIVVTVVGVVALIALRPKAAA